MIFHIQERKDCTLNTDDGVEISSVEEYMKSISELNSNRRYKDSQIFYRGQEVDIWKVEPSIFRDNLLSIEHILMSEPLRQAPDEFRNLSNSFEIMEKYQHYGLCTRLLDITTNPLVALYFACAPHEVVEYVDEDNGKYNKEPSGVVYYKEERSPILYNSFQTRVVSQIAEYDLKNGVKIGSILEKLYTDGVISLEQKEKWFTIDGVSEFISIAQGVYTILPILSNERLIRQSGAFLLPGKCNFSIVENDVESGYIYKCECNLRDEFEKEFFYIQAENKEKILWELEACNISSASLFPELEYQLKYIRKVNESRRSFVSYFEKFENYSFTEKEKESTNTFDRTKAEKVVLDVVKDKQMAEEIIETLDANKSIDWLKRNSILSAMKIAICKILISHGEDKNRARNIADKVMEAVKEVHLK